MRELIAYVRIVASRSSEQHPDDWPALAARLFAVLSTILRADPAGTSLEKQAVVPSASSIGRLLDRLRALSDDAALHAELLSALHRLDGEFALRRDLTLIGSVELEVIHVGKKSYLGGIVFWWPRCASAMAEMRRLRWNRQRRQLGPPLPMPPLPHPEDGLSAISFYWEDGNAALSLEVGTPSNEESSLVRESGVDLLRRGGFRIALCPLLSTAFSRFTVSVERGLFVGLRGAPISDPKALRASLQRALEAVQRQAVHLAMFPELQVDESGRDTIRALLRDFRHRYPYAVLAGSTHVWRQPQTPKETDPWVERPVNEAVLLGRGGQALLRHHKRGPFRLTSEAIQSAPQFFLEEKQLVGLAARGGLPNEIWEWIAPGEEISVLETTLGRVVILICADALEASPWAAAGLVHKLRPDLLLLVAMSAETEPFERFASDLERWGISTVIVNAACVCSESKGTDLALCSLAFLQPDGAPPTRLRWRRQEPSAGTTWEGGVIEVWEWHSKPKDWRALAPRETPAGVQWLMGSDPDSPLGVVVDLGVHLG